jgi:hypothetical protein
MNAFKVSFITVLFSWCTVSSAFSLAPLSQIQQQQQQQLHQQFMPGTNVKSSFRHSSSLHMSTRNNAKMEMNRRSYMVQVATAISTAMVLKEAWMLPANAMAMVTVAEFESILRTSGKSTIALYSCHI